MIKVERGVEPNYLKSEMVDLAWEKLEEFYNSTNRNQKRYNFPFNKEIDRELKGHLHNVFHAKCGYCETKIENADSAVVDRFRPHDGVRDKKEYFEDLYWWLVFSWDNLVYSCKECSQHKANYFPIKGRRVVERNQSFDSENRTLLDPCADDGFSHFTYRDGYLHSETDQGLQTIELLNLNRTSLIERRKNSLFEIDVIIERIGDKDQTELNYLNQIFDKDARIEYLLAKHEYLLEQLDLNPHVRKYIINDHEELSDEIDPKNSFRKVRRTNSKLVTSDYFPIEFVEIQNFRSIGSLRIEFPVDGIEQHSWVSLLGENGYGKSSILQAFCLGIAPNIRSGDDLSQLIKTGKDESVIKIKQRDSENILITKLIREGNRVEHVGIFLSSLIGYGSIRLLPDKPKKEKPGRRLIFQNLFDPRIPLSNVLEWIATIYQEDRESFDRIAIVLKQLLPDEVDDDLTIRNGELFFSKTNTPYKSFSDGYKGTIALALDIMKNLSDGRTDFSKISGIVIIDELGNQLHPRWQMRVVKQLRKAFPKVNFIVSTHHPLCLRGLLPGETIVLDKDEKREIFAIQELPDASTMRVDQLLASEFFGLSSLIDPDIEAQFNRYYELLNRGDTVTDEEIEESKRLKDELRNKNQMGSSLREELMYTVIDRLFAEKVMYNKNPLNRGELKDEAVNRIKKIWKNLNLSEND